MNIKDFSVRQTVYVLEEKRGRERELQTHEYKVVSIGRKYLKASKDGSDRFPTEFYSPENRNDYLRENKDWAEPLKLFPTKEALTDYIEKEMLIRWLMEAAKSYNAKEYTLEQLRAARKILEGQENG